MNIKLISDKKIFNFDLPFEANLKYIKKLSTKLFKCDLLDIYYKGDKITKEENEEKTLLRDIIPEGDSNIKLKIVLNSTLNSTKNQTPSTSNSHQGTNKTLDLGEAKIFENSNNLLLYQNQTNKLFEAIYTQKTKKLFTSIKDFNKKIIEIDNFLYKKKKNYRNDNLNSFEKNLYEFIDGLRIYFTKLVTALEYNNYATYNEMVHNLELFYDLLNYNEDMGQEFNCQTCREIEASQINKFPINLKKCDKNYSLNSERYNYFNKSSKKPSIKKDLISNMRSLKNNFDLKASILKDSKLINKNENKEEIEMIKKIDSNNNKKLIVVVGNNNSLSEENNNNNNYNKSEYNNNNQDNSEDKKLELNSTKKISESDISKKSINNISVIMNKTSDSNKNIMNEEEINNINNITPKSNKSNDTSENQKVPLNLNLITQKTKKENKLYKEQKTSNRVVQVLNNQKPKKKSNLNSTIKENENENCTNSSYYNNMSNNKSKSKHRNKSITSNSSRNSGKSNNTRYTKKSMNNKSVKSNRSNITKDNRIVKDDSIKNKLTKNSDKNSEFLKELNNSNNTNTNNNNEVKKNAASSYPKTEKSQKKLVKINEPRKSIYEPPIYHITSSNENDMAKVLSRKMVMKKKKNKTNNKYDFLI